eukprot:scaffold1439_cov404-Prasinococcus_capsulatus_cf.AAC.47
MSGAYQQAPAGPPVAAPAAQPPVAYPVASATQAPPGQVMVVQQPYDQFGRPVPLKIVYFERRKQYLTNWSTTLCDAPCSDPGYYCFACCCPWCASYGNRVRFLRGDMSKYLCCGGYVPCSGRCGERHCPEYCLLMEVMCCFPNSVASTRWLLQDEMQLSWERDRLLPTKLNSFDGFVYGSPAAQQFGPLHLRDSSLASDQPSPMAPRDVLNRGQRRLLGHGDAEQASRAVYRVAPGLA